MTLAENSIPAAYQHKNELTFCLFACLVMAAKDPRYSCFVTRATGKESTWAVLELLLQRIVGRRAEMPFFNPCAILLSEP